MPAGVRRHAGLEAHRVGQPRGIDDQQHQVAAARVERAAPAGAPARASRGARTRRRPATAAAPRRRQGRPPGGRLDEVDEDVGSHPAILPAWRERRLGAGSRGSSGASSEAAAARVPAVRGARGRRRRRRRILRLPRGAAAGQARSRCCCSARCSSCTGRRRTPTSCAPRSSTTPTGPRTTMLQRGPRRPTSRPGARRCSRCSPASTGRSRWSRSGRRPGCASTPTATATTYDGRRWARRSAVHLHLRPRAAPVPVPDRLPRRRGPHRGRPEPARPGRPGRPGVAAGLHLARTDAARPRLDRLDAAARIAAARTGRGARRRPGRAAARRPGALPAGATAVVLHTAVLAVPAAGAPGGVRRPGALLRRALDRPGGRRASCRAPRRDLPPGPDGLPSSCRLDGRPLALTAPHGGRIDWLPDRRGAAVTGPTEWGTAVGVGPWTGPLAGRPALRPRAARRGRPAQRRRPLPLLDRRGDRRRPRPAPAPLPRGDRELRARPQHRDRRPHGQRLPRRRGAHRRPPPLEPARRDGHRPLPAPAPPRRRRRAGWRSPAGEGLPVVAVDNAPGRRAARDRASCPSGACCCSARRARG